MALFVPGMACVICGKPMVASTDTVALPPFVANRTDPLFAFSDAIMHSACFAQHPLSADAERWCAETKRRTAPSQRICEVCGDLIVDPDDYFGTGLLARDTANPLLPFNFIHLHRSHAIRWNGLEQLRVCMAAAETSGEWRGPRFVVVDGKPRWERRDRTAS